MLPEEHFEFSELLGVEQTKFGFMLLTILLQRIEQTCPSHDVFSLDFKLAFDVLRCHVILRFRQE